jgi:hypothetical protein
MHDNNITVVQDSSTHAMTEVALGLSMAFFALLIIALMSVTLPNRIDNTDNKLSQEQSIALDIEQQVSLSIKNQQDDHKPVKSLKSANEVILLFWGGQFFNTQQQLIDINQIDLKQNIIVAVDPQIPFNQLIGIQSQFAGTTLRLTKLNEPWLLALNKQTQSVAKDGP